MAAIFKNIFIREHFSVPIWFLPKFVLTGPNGSKSALIKVKAWRQTGDRPFSEPMLTQFTEA